MLSLRPQSKRLNLSMTSPSNSFQSSRYHHTYLPLIVCFVFNCLCTVLLFKFCFLFFFSFRSADWNLFDSIGFGFLITFLCLSASSRRKSQLNQILPANKPFIPTHHTIATSHHITTLLATNMHDLEQQQQPQPAVVPPTQGGGYEGSQYTGELSPTNLNEQSRPTNQPPNSQIDHSHPTYNHSFPSSICFCC